MACSYTKMPQHYYYYYHHHVFLVLQFSLPSASRSNQFPHGAAVPTRLIFWSSSILMFPEIFFTYFPGPYLTRLSAPITKRAVSAFGEIKRVRFDPPSDTFTKLCDPLHEDSPTPSRAIRSGKKLIYFQSPVVKKADYSAIYWSRQIT